MRKGKITKQIGASPTDSENKAADYFASLGHDVLFLSESKAQHESSADIRMCGKKWEIKTPREAGKYTIEHAVQHASKQAENVIIDLRQCKMHETKALAKIQKEANLRKAIKIALVITKTQSLLTLKGKFGKIKA